MTEDRIVWSRSARHHAPTRHSHHLREDHCSPFGEVSLTLRTVFVSIPLIRKTLRRPSHISRCPVRHLQRLGGLTSITVSVFSMSLPRLLARPLSCSGVKMLLPLLVLRERSVGLTLTGDRKLVPWVLRALGKVLRPAEEKHNHLKTFIKLLSLHVFKFCNVRNRNLSCD